MESKDINEFTDCEYYNVSCGGICDQCTLYGNTSTSITKCSDVANCFIKNLYKQVQDKKQQYEELRQLHNSCCEEFKQEVNLRIDAYNKLSRDFFNSKYCNTEHCKLLQEKQEEISQLEDKLFFAKEDAGNNRKHFYRTLDELRDKEQECEELKFTLKHTGLLDLMNENVQLKQVLGDIEQYIIKWAGLYFDEVCCKEILDILDKAKNTNKMEGQ